MRHILPWILVAVSHISCASWSKQAPIEDICVSACQIAAEVGEAKCEDTCQGRDASEQALCQGTCRTAVDMGLAQCEAVCR